MITVKHYGHNVQQLTPTICRITKICTVKKEPYSVDVVEREYEIWRNGAVIQRVMPQLDANQREFIISGLTPAEFDALYADDVGDDGDSFEDEAVDAG